MKPISRLCGALVVLNILWVGSLDVARADMPERQTTIVELQPLIQEALQNNPEVAAVRQQVLAMKERVPQARVLDDPEVKIQLWNTPESLNITKTDTTIYGLTQRFPVPGLLSQQEDVAIHEAAQSEQRLAAKVLEITSSVTMAYYELFYTHKAVAVHHAQVKLLREFFKIANAKFKVGKGSQVDVLRAQVELSKLFQHLPILEQRRETAQAHVNTLLDRAPLAVLGIPRTPDIQPLTYSLETLLEEALLVRPEIQEADLAVDQFQSATQLAKLRYYPHLRVELQRWQNFQADNGFGGNVMLNIPFSFWTKSKYDAGVREATALVAAARARKKTLENLTQFQIKDLVAQIQATQQVITLFSTTVLPQAKQALQAAYAGYRTDRSDFFDLIDAERALLSYQLEYFRTLANREQQMAQLEQVVGKDL
ncbi:MAG: outer membrane protein CzcC [Nitrospirales bacterium]|nr:MAG: outer membrane protein CzcC [Nitrospirales bacterium]